ncbi:RHS repeat domain-containing protein [Streptomyces sp. NPDC052016]|uniref:RHS repeat domain-containing protein n=1 Tax=Streptomyces sp. NPDC052016 TaxID=3365680 RepID=UPI0037D068AC
MVDDHHGTASMTVDATTQAITRRYTKPFGEARGATPPAWPDDKGFLGKPADADTGLTHIGVREYDPATGRFLSVDPILAPEDHESLNGYAYANNTPVTKSDPTGLRPITNCEHGCSDGKGGTYRDHLSPNGNGGWTYHSTQIYTQAFQYQKAGGGTGSGTMTVTIRTDGGHKSAQVVFKKGPDPKPQRKDGSQCRACWAMGTNPYYNPKADDLPDRPKLATWQKVVLGVVVVVATAVAVAPVAVALGEGCLATAPVCAAELAEMATGGASGGSAVVGSGAAAAGVKALATGKYGAATNAANGARLAEQLAYEVDVAAASAMFTKDGALTAETIARSMKIQEGSKMGNKHLKAYFEAHGGVDQWGKYATPRMNTPGGEGTRATFDIHFYKNEVSGEVYYYDYKVKLGGGERK